MEKALSLQTKCPSCAQAMQISALSCPDCQVELKGPFEGSPFSKLSSEQIQFLYLFVECEGKIGEMEKALGVSYPTVKNRLNELKTAMRESQSVQERNSGSNTGRILQILSQMESGEVDYEQGLKRIKEIKKGKS